MAQYAILPDQPIADMDAYVAAGGGRGLERAVELGPEATVERIKAAGLRGRGGAGFPTGVKWGSVRDAASEPGSTPYVACNAAEGEPGTYKDRRLMANNPFALVEGVLIAASVLEAPESFIAVKYHYTHEIGRLVTAQEQAIKADWPGADRLQIVPGPDDYLFGEEKALLEVIEGKLAMPRLLPPFQVGLFATMAAPNPTVANNVETFCHAAAIMADGPEAFRSVGTEDSPGTMIFTIVGDVERPGTYEMPLGITLGELLVDIAGAQDPKAILSGTSNPVGTAGHLDVPCCFKALSDAGFGLGSGGFIVYGQQRDMVQIAERMAAFLAAESCGQCTACKLGNADMAERLGLLVRGEGTPEDVEEITKRTEHVSDAARCFLPTGSAFTIRSIIDVFPEEFAERAQGVPSPPEVAVPVPKINSLDETTGEVVYAQKEY
jgi:NADH:ubiquinone oxidoreductase subunit F (NADH-binding)